MHHVHILGAYERLSFGLQPRCTQNICAYMSTNQANMACKQLAQIGGAAKTLHDAPCRHGLETTLTYVHQVP